MRVRKVDVWRRPERATRWTNSQSRDHLLHAIYPESWAELTNEWLNRLHGWVTPRNSFVILSMSGVMCAFVRGLIIIILEERRFTDTWSISATSLDFLGFLFISEPFYKGKLSESCFFPSFLGSSRRFFNFPGWSSNNPIRDCFGHFWFLKHFPELEETYGFHASLQWGAQQRWQTRWILAKCLDFGDQEYQFILFDRRQEYTDAAVGIISSTGAFISRRCFRKTAIRSTCFDISSCKLGYWSGKSSDIFEVLDHVV